MFVYVVKAKVEERTVPRFEEYMKERHIADVLSTGFFSAARMTGGDGLYRIEYTAADRAAIDAYLGADAARLRADFADCIPEGVTVEREIVPVIGDWSR